MPLHVDIVDVSRLRVFAEGVFQSLALDLFNFSELRFNFGLLLTLHFFQFHVLLLDNCPKSLLKWLNRVPQHHDPGIIADCRGEWTLFRVVTLVEQANRVSIAVDWAVSGSIFDALKVV
jgi:hypothetical protein